MTETMQQYSQGGNQPPDPGRADSVLSRAAFTVRASNGAGITQTVIGWAIGCRPTSAEFDGCCSSDTCELAAGPTEAEIDALAVRCSSWEWTGDDGVREYAPERLVATEAGQIPHLVRYGAGNVTPARGVETLPSNSSNSTIRTVRGADERKPKMTIITHSREAGTLIEGTAKGDGSNAILKTAGWRWSRNLGTWYVPHTRDRAARRHLIDGTAEQLREAGFTVEIEINDMARPAAAVERDRAQRAGERAEALAARAERRGSAAEHAQQLARAADARLPEGGEPIKIGHHSESRHRNAIARAGRAARRAITAGEEAEQAAQQAEAAALATIRRYNPVTVANRLETLGADLRRVERQLNGHTRTVYNMGDTRYVEASEPAQGEYAERLQARIQELQDQISYWEGVRAEQVAAGMAGNYGPETIGKGDQVKFRGSWYEVRRVNRKSVTVPSMVGGSWTDTVPYHELSGHRPAAV